MIAFPKPWGNYLLKDIVETKMPDEISWWPQTMAWKILLLAIIILIIKKAYFARKRYLANAYRRDALLWMQQFDKNPNESHFRQIPTLLKKVALMAFHPSDVAHLSGTEWESWLDQHCPQSDFKNTCPNVLYQLAYSPKIDIESPALQALVKETITWIHFHGEEM